MSLPLPAAPACRPLSASNTAAAAASPVANRVDWVDTAKGICLVLVVLLHSTRGVESALGATTWLHPLVEFARPFRMPDFFLLSGLFLARALRRERSDYFDAKLSHFVYFYVLWTLIQVGLKETSVLANDGAVAFAQHLANRLFLEPIGVMWFLYILCAFFVTAWIFRRAPAVLLALALPLHLFDDEIVAALPPALAAGSGLVWEYCSRLVFFVVGWVGAGWFFRLAESVSRRPRAAMAVLALWAGWNGLMVALGVHEVAWAGLVLGLVGSAAVATVAALVSGRGTGRWLRAAGRRSLVVFCSFFLGMAATRTVLLRFLPELDGGVVALLVFAAALLAPCLLLATIDRTGVGRFLIERPPWARPRAPAARSLQPAA